MPVRRGLRPRNRTRKQGPGGKAERRDIPPGPFLRMNGDASNRPEIGWFRFFPYFYPRGRCRRAETPPREVEPNPNVKMANQGMKIALFSLTLLLLGGCRAGVSTSRSAETRGASATKTCCDSTGSPSAEEGRSQILRGRVVVAHEVRSFVPEGDTTEYWLRDPQRSPRARIRPRKRRCARRTPGRG